MSGQLHFELDAPVQLFTLAATALLRAPAEPAPRRHLGGLVISPAVDSFSLCIDCYQRHDDTSSPLTGD
jgi:hypothetical protein